MIHGLSSDTWWTLPYLICEYAIVPDDASSLGSFVSTGRPGRRRDVSCRYPSGNDCGESVRVFCSPMWAVGKRDVG